MPAEKPTPKSDAELLLAASQGSHAAFETLYLRHRQMVLEFVGRRDRSLDCHAAEDVVADVFLRLWKKKQSLPSVQNINSYLIGIVKNILTSRLRSSRYTVEPLFELVDPKSEGASNILEKESLLHEFSLALAALPESHRRAFELRERGLTVKQIAERTHRTEKAIERLLEKARSTLRATLRE
jgi:RNA polymerase sigma-70 factor (ECF subfamily)